MTYVPATPRGKYHKMVNQARMGRQTSRPVESIQGKGGLRSHNVRLDGAGSEIAAARKGRSEHNAETVNQCTHIPSLLKLVREARRERGNDQIASVWRCGGQVATTPAVPASDR